MMKNPLGLFPLSNTPWRTPKNHLSPNQVKAHNTRRLQGRLTRAAFAENLAEGMSVEDAAEAAGMERGYGYRLLAQIRAELGPQAI